MATAKKKKGAAALKVVQKRASEPSTWAGLGAIASGLALAFPQYAALLTGLGVVAGGVAVMQGEKGDTMGQGGGPGGPSGGR